MKISRDGDRLIAEETGISSELYQMIRDRRRALGDDARLSWRSDGTLRISIRYFSRKVPEYTQKCRFRERVEDVFQAVNAVQGFEAGESVISGDLSRAST